MGQTIIQGTEQAQSGWRSAMSLLSWETVFAIFLIIDTCLSRATEGRVGLRWLTISGGFPSVTMEKVKQNMWLVEGGHGGFLTPWFRQEAEDTVWNQEWVDSPETSSY